MSYGNLICSVCCCDVDGIKNPQHLHGAGYLEPTPICDGAHATYPRTLIDDLRAQLAEALNDNVRKVEELSDEQIKALSRMGGHHPDDEAAIGRYACQQALLEHQLAECRKVIEDAPHDDDCGANEFTREIDADGSALTYACTCWKSRIGGSDGK